MKRAYTMLALALLCALTFVPLGTMGVSAQTQSNTVTLTIAGGDATALAGCLNAADTGNYSSVQQKNYCKNKAYAQGGDVILKNVDIFIVQTNVADGDTSDASNTVDLTIRGGDATSLAACVNAARTGKKGNVSQQNKCKNKAYAQGGNVILKNVDITIIQENL